MGRMNIKFTVDGCSTLGESKTRFLEAKKSRKLARILKHPVTIRFILKGNPPSEIPDSMTVGEFQDLEDQGLAFIDVDDGGRGRTITANVNRKKSK